VLTMETSEAYQRRFFGPQEEWAAKTLIRINPRVKFVLWILDLLVSLFRE
jgi:hypothetical protein